MSAEPPRNTIHVVQHLLFDGLRILRAQLPNEVADDKLIADLDRTLALLEPMTGMPIRDAGPRLYGLAHGLHVLVDDLLPYINTHTIDLRDVPSMLSQIEERLQPLREAGYRWAPDERTGGRGRTDLNVR
jgi:hypothetical protein